VVLKQPYLSGVGITLEKPGYIYHARFVLAILGASGSSSIHNVLKDFLAVLSRAQAKLY
jgi:hypothetical protein